MLKSGEAMQVRETVAEGGTTKVKDFSETRCEVGKEGRLPVAV